LWAQVFDLGLHPGGGWARTSRPDEPDRSVGKDATDEMNATTCVGDPGRTLRAVQISSLGTYVPPRVLTNSQLEQIVDTSDEWILKRTGIRERHIADDDVATSDLAVEAARIALAGAGVTAADIGFLVVGTTTPDTFFPSTACLVQDRLGATRAWGFDLGAACSGFTYSVTTAMQMVASGAHDHALAIGADVMSRIIDYEDRTTCVIFGDGAGAVVVSPAVDPELRILDFAHEVDGSGGPRSGSPPVEAGYPRHMRRSTSDSTTCIRMARRCSSSLCERRARSVIGSWLETGCVPPTSTCLSLTRRTGGSSRPLRASSACRKRKS